MDISGPPRPATFACIIVNHEPHAVFYVHVNLIRSVYQVMEAIKSHLGAAWEDRIAGEMDLYFAKHGDEWLSLSDPDVKALLQQGETTEGIAQLLGGSPLKTTLRVTTVLPESSLKTMADDQLHILVKLRPPVQEESFVPRPLPTINYEWKEPQPLISSASVGSTWDFQSPFDVDEISKTMRKHYRAWKEKRDDKSCHPIFTCIDGPGTGKSRLLDEFPRMLQEELVYPPNCEDAASMKKMLKKALVFKISFSREEVYWSVTSTVGCRMIFQLQDQLPWDIFSRFTSPRMTPDHVLWFLAQELEIPRDELCVILCVDDLQCLAKSTHDTVAARGEVCDDVNVPFHDTMRTLARLVNGAEYWVTVICSSTSFTDIYEYDILMRQWRVEVATRPLAHPTANGKRVFGSFSMEDAHLMEVLVDDMGGLPCALIELYQVLDTKSKTHGVQMFSFDAVYDWIVQAFRAKYPMNATQLASVRLAFLAVLRCESVTHLSHFGDLSLDKVLACGLMRVQNDCLMCPYVLYMLLDSEASPWEFLEQYLPRKERSDRSPWTTWEDFNIKFRVLKSLAWGEINDPYLRWGNLHEGARCGDYASTWYVIERPRIYVRLPTGGNSATKTSSPGLSQGACGCRHDSDCLYVGMKNETTSQVVLQDSSLTSDMTTMESVVMEASKVPIPPSVTLSFLSIEVQDQGFVHEVQLYDHHHDEQRPLTIREAKRVKKSAVGPDDYLMVYAMGKIPFQPESLGNCAIVDRENALAYYTVFGKRAVFLQKYGAVI